ncbi:MAG: hypothetical protein H6734_08805 [Alphaproteobacteria bacterium]|nr:hypothetical protein [Alphaproteobacteria bacterium]
MKRLTTVPVAEPGPQVITERVPDALGAPSTVEASEASWAWEDDKVARADRVVTAASAEMGLTETEATEVRAALIAFIEGRASRWRAMKGQEKVDTAAMIAQTRASRQALTDALTKAIGAKRTARVLELFRDPATRF